MSALLDVPSLDEIEADIRGEAFGRGFARANRPAPSPLPNFAPLSWEDLADMTDPAPLIDNMLPTAGLAVVAGAPAAGKTFAVLDMAACVATGVPFHGRAVSRGHVLYVAGEDLRGIVQRLHAWRARHGYDGDMGMSFLGHEDVPQLADPVHMSALGDLVARLRPALVVIDTLSRSIVGENENDAATMSRVARAADALRLKHPEVTVLLVSHTTKSTGAVRGSSALVGAADVVYLVGSPSADVSVMVRDKNKSGPVDDEWRFTRRPVPGTDSVVLWTEDEDDEAGRSTRAEAEAEHSNRDRAWLLLWRAFGDSLTFTRPEAVRLLGDPADGSDGLPRSSAQLAFRDLLTFDVVLSVGTIKAPRFRLDYDAAMGARLPRPLAVLPVAN